MVCSYIIIYADVFKHYNILCCNIKLKQNNDNIVYIMLEYLFTPALRPTIQRRSSLLSPDLSNHLNINVVVNVEMICNQLNNLSIFLYSDINHTITYNQDKYLLDEMSRTITKVSKSIHFGEIFSLFFVPLSTHFTTSSNMGHYIDNSSVCSRGSRYSSICRRYI